MARKTSFGESLLCWVLLILFLYFFFVFGHDSEMSEARMRANQSRAKGIMREGSGLIDTDFKKQGRVFPGAFYCGPLTGEMVGKLGGDGVRFRDPFSRDKTNRFLRYFSNGTDCWALISQGPDEQFDLTSPTLLRIAALPDFEARRLALAPYSFDPSNGTVSAGDIIRVNGQE